MARTATKTPAKRAVAKRIPPAPTAPPIAAAPPAPAYQFEPAGDAQPIAPAPATVAAPAMVESEGLIWTDEFTALGRVISVTKGTGDSTTTYQEVLPPGGTDVHAAAAKERLHRRFLAR